MAVTEQRNVGASILRKEDPELLTGRGKYTDDLVLPGMLHMILVRSPFAHATITGVDVSKAASMPGVVAAYSGDDLASEWAGPLPVAWPVTPDIKSAPMWPITRDKARYQGDVVAVVVAESTAQAKDAAEAVDVGYDELPVVVGIEAALADG